MSVESIWENIKYTSSFLDEIQRLSQHLVLGDCEIIATTWVDSPVEVEVEITEDEPDCLTIRPTFFGEALDLTPVIVKRKSIDTENIHQDNPAATKPSKAEKAYEEYDFGTNVEGSSGWDTSDPMDFHKIVFLENEDPSKDSLRCAFHVRFDSNHEVQEIYALDMSTGNMLGKERGGHKEPQDHQALMQKRLKILAKESIKNLLYLNQGTPFVSSWPMADSGGSVVLFNQKLYGQDYAYHYIDLSAISESDLDNEFLVETLIQTAKHGVQIANQAEIGEFFEYFESQANGCNADKKEAMLRAVEEFKETVMKYYQQHPGNKKPKP